MAVHFNKSQEGFSLIEFIVIIGIIAIMSGMTLAQYNVFNSTGTLNQQSKQLYDVLDLARKKATAGDESNIDCSSFGQLQGYRVTISSNSYTLSEYCNSGNSSTLTTYTIPSNTQISLSPTGSITFKTLSQGITGLSSITLKQANTNTCVTISIETTGNITTGSPFRSGC